MNTKKTAHEYEHYQYFFKIKDYLSTVLLSDDDGGVLWPLLLVDPLSD
jgi:hypothetical protein